MQLLINIDELWLKGKNRNWYYKIVIDHIKFVLKNYELQTIQNQGHVLVVSIKKEIDQNLKECLQKIPGVYAFSPCHEISLENLEQDVIDFISKRSLAEGSFKVFVKRANKNYPKTSVEVAAYLGAIICENFPKLHVDLVNFKYRIEVRLCQGHAFINLERFLGVGGLPVKTSGKGLSLISGGIDSPVASFMMNKRGLELDYIFFYSYPLVSEEVLDKVKKIVSELAAYQKNTNFYVIEFANIQKWIVTRVNERYRTLVFRLIMMNIAKRLALKINASVLVTGDSLGQVSSQTLANLKIVDEITNYLVFRPLIGLNKAEIIQTLRKLGLENLTAIPCDDACSIIAPKNPITNPKRDYIIKFWENNISQISSLSENMIIYRFSGSTCLSCDTKSF